MKFGEDCVEIIYSQLTNYGNVSGEMCWLGLINWHKSGIVSTQQIMLTRQNRGTMADRLRIKVKCSIFSKAFTLNILLRC